MISYIVLGPQKIVKFFLHLNKQSEKLIHAIQGNLFKLDKHGEIWLKQETNLNKQ